MTAPPLNYMPPPARRLTRAERWRPLMIDITPAPPRVSVPQVPRKPQEPQE